MPYCKGPHRARRMSFSCIDLDELQHQRGMHRVSCKWVDGKYVINVEFFPSGMYDITKSDELLFATYYTPIKSFN